MQVAFSSMLRQCHVLLHPKQSCELCCIASILYRRPYETSGHDALHRQICEQPWNNMRMTCCAMQAADAGGNATACIAASTEALKIEEACGSAAAECSFAGAWGGAASHVGRSFYVMSYFFDRCALNHMMVIGRDACLQTDCLCQLGLAAHGALGTAASHVRRSLRIMS